jgi:hypothetical protein
MITHKHTILTSDTRYRHLNDRAGHIVSSRVTVTGLTSDLNALHFWLLHLGLGHGDGEHAVLQAGLHLVHLGVLRQAEPRDELPAAALDAVPGVVLVLRLLGALAADDQHTAVLHLDLDLLLLHAGDVGFEHVRLGGLLPVDARVGEGGGLAGGDDGVGTVPVKKI